MRYNVLQAVNIQIVHKRFFTNDNVRVRFAPSPTGWLHLGGLRTALYNYLFARANNGSFILRIEDTDRTRIIPEAVEKIQNDLLWAGIIPDEDPTRGGPMGPYLQSKRIDLYKEQADILLMKKKAYYCFCTPQRLNLIRKEAVRCGQIPKYDNKCRDLNSDEITERLSTGVPCCIRFKLHEAKPFNDMIHGEIYHDFTQNEGDPVIMKVDGFPTYHFANVVDDHFMKITHVLRGIEWQISTPKHIMLYDAFRWKPPKFGHLPLILNANGTKLSKRQDDIFIESYRQNGIFPLALLNYVTSAGGGFRRNEDTDYIDSFQGLIQNFDISKIKPSSGKLLDTKLLEYNKLEIVKLLENEKNFKFLVDRVIKVVSDAFSDKGDTLALQLDEHYIISNLKWAQHRITNLNDLTSPNMAFLWTMPSTPPNIAKFGCSDAIKLLNVELGGIDIGNFNRFWMLDYLRKFAKSNGIMFPKFAKVLRIILTGTQEGPPIAETMEILGKERTLYRLQRCVCAGV